MYKISPSELFVSVQQMLFCWNKSVPIPKMTSMGHLHFCGILQVWILQLSKQQKQQQISFKIHRYNRKQLWPFNTKNKHGTLILHTLGLEFLYYYITNIFVSKTTNVFPLNAPQSPSRWLAPTRIRWHYWIHQRTWSMNPKCYSPAASSRYLQQRSEMRTRGSMLQKFQSQKKIHLFFGY